jgi:branched-subunit amino acid ABC-type transport system permease component
MLVVVAVAVSISAVVSFLLVQKWQMTGYPDFPTIVLAALAIVVPATLGVLANYLYWRPRYRVR